MCLWWTACETCQSQIKLKWTLLEQLFQFSYMIALGLRCHTEVSPRLVSFLVGSKTNYSTVQSFSMQSAICHGNCHLPWELVPLNSLAYFWVDMHRLQGSVFRNVLSVMEWAWNSSSQVTHSYNIFDFGYPPRFFPSQHHLNILIQRGDSLFLY